MIVRIKKMTPGGVARIESGGDIRELILKEDLLSPSLAKMIVCFRGKYSSGVVELSVKEAENLAHDIQERIKLLKNVKVFKPE